MTKYQKTIHHWKHFNYTGEYADYLEALPKECRITWFAHYNTNFDAQIKLLRNGYMQPMKKVEAILEQMQDEEVFTNHTPLPRAGMVGNSPRIAAMLSGSPKTMTMRKHDAQMSLNTPLKIYVETDTSGGIGPDPVFNRGVALLAFIMAMQQVRPVELFIVNASTFHGRNRSNSGVTIRIPSNPIDLGVACYMLTHQGCTTGLSFTGQFGVQKHNYINYNIAWLWNSNPNVAEYRERFRIEFEMDNEAIFFPGGYLSDHLMLNDPVKWVKQKVEKHNLRQIEGSEIE